MENDEDSGSGLEDGIGIDDQRTEQIKNILDNHIVGQLKIVFLLFHLSNFQLSYFRQKIRIKNLFLRNKCVNKLYI